MPPLLLDTRPESAFLAAHHPEAANVPLAELAARVHELPRRHVAMAVYDDHPTRARWAASRLRARGFEQVRVADDALARVPPVAGPARVRLWQPHDLLVTACDHIFTNPRAFGKPPAFPSFAFQSRDVFPGRYVFQSRDREGAVSPPPSAPTRDARPDSTLLPSRDREEAGGRDSASPLPDGRGSEEIPSRDRPQALDLACGTGRDAVYLALRGCRVEAWDILPDALERAADLARRNRVELTTRCIDVERSEAWPVEAAFDLITVFNFLHRPLFDAIRRALRPGGWLVHETFVEPQRERFGKPRRADHVLRAGELRAHFADWDIHLYREQLTNPRRIAAGLIARKPLGACTRSARA